MRRSLAEPRASSRDKIGDGLLAPIANRPSVEQEDDLRTLCASIPDTIGRNARSAIGHSRAPND
jgi:hypothetical protein